MIIDHNSDDNVPIIRNKKRGINNHKSGSGKAC